MSTPHGPTRKKRAFLSHCRSDVVLARLISHVLQENGVSCFVAERETEVGEEFDSRIIAEIHQSDVLLVLWSSNSRSAPWVNQEIGIALGRNIPVWPIAIERVGIDGAMFRKQGSYLCDNDNPYSEIARLAQAIGASLLDDGFEPQVDRYIIGKEERTRFLTRLLSEENERLGKRGSTPKTYTIRIQAAFSSISVSEDPAYRITGYHSPDYHHALIEERRELERVLRWANARVILWPQRPYEDEFMQIRIRSLLNYLRAVRDPGRLRFVWGSYTGGNQHILDRKVLIAGIKAQHAVAPGYEVTTVAYHGPTVSAAIEKFDRRFDQLWESHCERCGRSAVAIRDYVIAQLEAFECNPAKDADT